MIQHLLLKACSQHLWHFSVIYMIYTGHLHLAFVGADCLGPRSSDAQVNQHECWHSMLEVEVLQCKDVPWETMTAACDILDDDDAVAYSNRRWKRGVALEVSENHGVITITNICLSLVLIRPVGSEEIITVEAS